MSSLNATPSGERVHIGFFGRRNAGKSSLVNAVTGQKLAVVSDVPGTTTDPVSKAMEILPLGPVVIIDTPGFDDEGSLGELRVEQTRKILSKTDIAVLVVDSIEGIKESDIELAKLFAERRIPYVLVLNKSDLSDDYVPTALETLEDELNGSLAPAAVLDASAVTGEGINDLKNAIAKIKPDEEGFPIVRDKIKEGDIVLLVVPIDEAAPKGRLILPQQQTIRDILDAGASAVVVKDTELEETLAKLDGSARPALVITDSQVFGKVMHMVPEDMLLTSFSILMARHKGLLDEAVRGIAAIDNLKDGDKVLIAEGCTHHRQCGDIGSVKIPKWLSEYTKKELVYETVSGTEYPADLSGYALVIHCGGCMLNEKEVVHRTREAASQGVPITNYGTLIAQLNGILNRSLEIFPEYIL
jgi:[FeFe] hydrogenase H-cluster maturation GTPase HydF